MLRRRMLLIMMGCFRWARAKTRVIMSGVTKVTLAQSTQAESSRSITVDKYATPEVASAIEAAVGKSVQTKRVSKVAGPHEPVQGHSFRQVLMGRKSNAYSAFEAPGRKNGSLVLSRLADAITALGVVATNRREIANGVIARANSVDAIEVESAKGIATSAASNVKVVNTESVVATKDMIVNRIADPDTADAREANATKFISIDKEADADVAQTVLVDKQSGIQNSAHTRAALYIKNYVDNNVLILKQVYGATIEEHVLVLDSAIYPEQIDTDLYIQQIYEAVQNGTNLNFNRNAIV